MGSEPNPVGLPPPPLPDWGPPPQTRCSGQRPPKVLGGGSSPRFSSAPESDRRHLGQLGFVVRGDLGPLPAQPQEEYGASALAVTFLERPVPWRLSPQLAGEHSRCWSLCGVPKTLAREFLALGLDFRASGPQEIHRRVSNPGGPGLGMLRVPGRACVLSSGRR